MNDAQRAKQSATMRARWADPAYRAMRTRRLQQPWAEAARAKQRARAQARWADPAMRAYMLRRRLECRAARKGD